MSGAVVSILGVEVRNATKAEAVALMESWILGRDGRSRAVFLVNAHTLNLSWEDPAYRQVLEAGDAVFGDGAGVRLAARLKGVRMRDNLVGTDLLPAFFAATRRRGYRYFLLGSDQPTVDRAADRLGRDFPGIDIVGRHHGFLDGAGTRAVIEAVNAARPDMLIVGMGNPLQERWIHGNLGALRVPVSIGVGGLFDHWAGKLKRAPLWVRRLGVEWMQLLVQQPYKWRRWVLGNPKFVARALRDLCRERPRLGAGYERETVG